MALEGSARFPKSQTMPCCMQPPNPPFNCTVPFTAPQSQRRCGKCKQNPREGEEGWETTPKISAASPEIGTQPSVSQAGGRVGVLVVLGIRCGWEKDASDPNHNVGVLEGTQGSPYSPWDPLTAALGLQHPSTPGQAHGTANSAPEMGPKSQSKAGLGVPGPSWGQAEGLHFHPFLSSTTLQPEGALGSLQVPPARGFAAGSGPTFSIRSRDAAG